MRERLILLIRITTYMININHLFFLKAFRILPFMRVFLIGESAKHCETLMEHLPPGVEFIALPREAATTCEHDHRIGGEDVLVSLRFARHKSPSPRFKLLHIPGAGLDGIDFASLPDCATVCNVFEHEIPIAEYVMTAMLEHEIGYANMVAEFKGNRWPDLYRARMPHGELSTKTLGIIGYGRIGREVAKRANAFGMRVLAANRSPVSADRHLSADTLPLSKLDNLLSASDYVLIACPLSDATRGLVGAAALAQMSRHAVLINVSRAEIVEQKALYESLENGRIGGAVLDVWWQYPLTESDHPEPAQYPFDRLPNVRATPHCSAWTHQLPLRRYRAIAQNIERLLTGKAMSNVVWEPRQR